MDECMATTSTSSTIMEVTLMMALTKLEIWHLKNFMICCYNNSSYWNVTSFNRVNFLIGISMMLVGISLLLAFRSTDFFVILLSVFISGLGTGGVYLLTISFLQASTSIEIRGRVFGNFYTIGRLALLISFLLSGIIANYLDGIFGQDGVYLVLIGSSTLILISGILNFINGYRSIFNEFGIEKSNFNKIKLKLDEKE